MQQRAQGTRGVEVNFQAVEFAESKRLIEIARALKAGTVWVNCYGVIDPTSPFGGFKQSGFGRELGKHSLELYTQVKQVWLKV